MARPRKFEEGQALNTARGLFWRHGYNGVSIADLSDATGVRSQSLYGVFHSKHDLFTRTLNEYGLAQIEALTAGQGAATSSWQWLLDVVTFTDDRRAELTPDGCYLAGSTAAMSRTDEDVAAVAHSTYDAITDLFESAVIEAQAAEEVRKDVSARHIAVASLTVMQGIEFMRRARTDSGFEEAKAAARAGLRYAYEIA